MKAIKWLPLVFVYVAMVFSSCGKEKDESSADEQLKYKYYKMEHAGWKSKTHTQKVDDISFNATEVPTQYYLLKELGSNNLAEIDSVYEQNKMERLVEFQFMQDDEKDLLAKEFTGMDYQESVKYMSFSIERDFYAVTSKHDTIQCSGVTFERNFKIAPNQKLLLFFTGIPPEDRIQLVYQDYLFNKGVLKFTFNEKTKKLLL